MPRTVIKADILNNGFEEVLQALDELETYLNKGLEELPKRCAEMAADQARNSFADAPYAGYNDVKVLPEKTSEGYAVVARGDATLFIEFGTGINNTTNLQERTEVSPAMAPLGQYGRKKASNPKGWTYLGDDLAAGGNSPHTEPARSKKTGEIVHSKDGRIVFKTTGDSGVSPMYRAREMLIQNTQAIADEVFKKG